LDAPDAGPRFASWKRDADGNGLAVGTVFRFERQIVEIVFRIAFLLPAVLVEVLAEVAKPVHEANAHEGEAQVACRLQMVAGQDAEAARVDRDTVVNAEFSGEIRNAAIASAGVGLFEPPSALHVFFQTLGDAMHVGEKALVLLELLPPRRIDGAE